MQRRKVPPLGNIAQSSTEAHFEGENNYKRIAKRRFALHRLQSELLPDEKALNACCLHAAPGQWISGNFNPKTGQAHFGGLKHCDSPNCILCAPRRAEEARRKLTVLFAECQRQGKHVYHLIFTFSHSWGDSLAWERDTLQGALKETFQGDWFTRLEAEIGYVGRVRSFENTFGENGWHLHAHIPLICENEVDIEQFQADLFARYNQMLSHYDATASAERGVRVEIGYSSLADYVAKYGHDPVIDQTGLENEIAEGRLKTGKLNSLTPFELLAAAHGESYPLQKLMLVTHGRYTEAQCMTLAAELFIENFDTFKGKPRLVWSKKLWQKMGMDEAMDYYDLSQETSESEMMLELEPQGGWKQVRGNRKEKPDLRAELLTELASGSFSRVKAWLIKNGISALVYECGGNGQWVNAEFIEVQDGSMIA